MTCSTCTYVTMCVCISCPISESISPMVTNFIESSDTTVTITGFSIHHNYAYLLLSLGKKSTVWDFARAHMGFKMTWWALSLWRGMTTKDKQLYTSQSRLTLGISEWWPISGGCFELLPTTVDRTLTNLHASDQTCQNLLIHTCTHTCTHAHAHTE